MSNHGGRWTTLGEVAKWGSGGTPSAGDASFYGGDIPWAVIGDLNDGKVTSTSKSITQKGLENSSAKLVPEGAILIAMYGSIGKLGIASLPMATNQAIAFAIPDINVVDRDYLFWLLMYERPQFVNEGKGATQQNISQTLLKSWRIFLPPIDEQHEAVERIESAIAKTESISNHLSDVSRRTRLLRRATLLEAHNSSSDAADYRVLSLRSLGTWVGGSTPSKSKSEYWVGGSIPWVTSKDVKSEFIHGSMVRVSERAIGSSLLKVQPAGSVVLVARSGILEHTLPIAQAKVDFTLNQDLKACVPSEDIDSEWLLRVLQAHEKDLLQRYRKAGTTVANLNIDDFLEHKVAVPPLAIQRKICEGISRKMELIDGIVVQTALRLAEMKTLRRTVMHQAFGEREAS